MEKMCSTERPLGPSWLWRASPGLPPFFTRRITVLHIAFPVTEFLKMQNIWKQLLHSWYQWLIFSFFEEFGMKACLLREMSDFSDFQTLLHSPKSLIMHGFHFSVSLTFHINDHLLPDGKAMMVSNEVCPYPDSTWLTGLLWENRPLSVFSKD